VYVVFISHSLKCVWFGREVVKREIGGREFERREVCEK